MRAEITKDLAAAFGADLADAVKSFTLSRQIRKKSSWTVNDGGSVTTRTITGRGIFMGYGVREIDGETIRRTDVKLIALQAECELIQPNDRIDGMTVIHVTKDPADVAWVVQLRVVADGR